MTTTVSAPTTRVSPYEILGENVTGLTDLDTIAMHGGIDWSVKMEPIRAAWAQAPGATDDAPVHVSSDDHMAVVRQDTGEILAVHTSGYRPTQYRDILELGLTLTEQAADGSAVESIGTMGGGKQFYATINLGDILIDPNGAKDVTQHKLALFGSHDGSLGITFATTNLRVSCTNQAPAIRRDAHRLIVVKHTKNSDDRLRAVAAALDMGEVSRVQYEQDANALLAAPMRVDGFLKVVERVYPWKHDAEGATATKQENRRDTLVSIFKSDTCVGSVGENRWAAFNAFTEYLDHGRGTTADKRALATVAPDKWVAKLKLNVGNLLLNMN